MSLDVDLYYDVEAKFHNGRKELRQEVVFSANVTHNLYEMAKACGIYEACWRPENLNVQTAGELIPLLEAGLRKLKSNPVKYRKFDAPNGWGTYEGFVPWVEKYLNACKEHPEAKVEVWR